MFVKHLNQPLCNNESGNHGNNEDKLVSPGNSMPNQATGDVKLSSAADPSKIDIEIILSDHQQHRAGTKSAKLSDVEIVKLSPGVYSFVHFSS